MATEGTDQRSANRFFTPAFRRLRGYAFDPSLSTQLESAFLNQVVFPVVWEEPERLGKGPVGEYVEVVDYDPASQCFYAPVDLNDPNLLAQDGLPPSESNPKFHQQMVYAVAMTTIRNFERALGRWAIWSPYRPNSPNEEYVRRLRIYPHALREANAYYSPKKKALLFGYFPASMNFGGTNFPGGTVFTCLSHDVVAHETTHALLDGMHGRYIEPTGPDALAFHEAFADIIALFQHFTFPEVLRQQIARTRGDLATENLLGQLAQQFGTAIGQYGALRDAIGQVNPETGRWEPLLPNPAQYQTVGEAHARGAILVAAIFDAFISIYKKRSADLMRIASGGTGVLPAGALHPDLVNRLAKEAAKSADQILNLCIRGLDYAPVADMTFGTYLRAIITADSDIVADDNLGYRIAVIEAFRRRGIFPDGVRTLSVESLHWPRTTMGLEFTEKLLDFPQKARYFATREQTYQETKELRGWFHGFVKRNIATWQKYEDELGLALSPQRQLPGLGVDEDGIPRFEVASLWPLQRVGPDRNSLNQLIISIMQRRELTASGKSGDGEPTFFFRGGCTLILDLDSLTLRYAIPRPIDDPERIARQREYMQGELGGSLRATYFAPAAAAGYDEPFALIHREF